jgi:hypothetical protein
MPQRSVPLRLEVLALPVYLSEVSRAIPPSSLHFPSRPLTLVEAPWILIRPCSPRVVPWRLISRIT